MNAQTSHYRFVETQLRKLVAVADAAAATWDKPTVERMIDAREYGLALDMLAGIFLGIGEPARADALPMFDDLAARMHLLEDPEYRDTSKLLAQTT
jgi:hypothetical protein